MRRILYLTDQPFDQRNFDRFGVQAWLDRGWQVLVWDVTPLGHPRVWKEYVRLGGQLKEFAGYVAILSKVQLRQAFATLQGIGHFIDFTGDYAFVTRVKRRLVRMGIVRVSCSTGSIPLPGDGTRRRLGQKLGKAIAAGPLRTLRLLRGSITQGLAAAHIRPGVMVVSGTQSAPGGGSGPGVELVAAHNLDYDTYLNIRGAATRPARPYAVFVDQDYCFHLEYIYQDVSAVTPAKYFPAMCHALRTIARALDLDVRVAAHPRAAYQHRPDYFEGIPLEHGRTAELIRDCAVVVCHDSTAIQLAVLFHKPVIFLTTDELDSVFIDTSLKRESIARFASELGKSVINVDRDLEEVNWVQETSVDRRKYAEYRNKYIKIDGSPEMPYWQIVIDHFEKQPQRLSSAAASVV
jgi:hypothetical protein